MRPQPPAGDIGTAHLAMLVFAAFVSGSFTVGEAITFGLDPALVTFFRFGLGSVILAVVVAARGHWHAPAPRDIARYILLSLPTVIFFILMFEALRHTSAVNTSAIFTLLPALTALVAMPLLGQSLTAFQWLAMGIGAAGAAWIVFGGSIAHFLAFRLGPGELIHLAGTFAYAFYAPLVRKLHRGEPMPLYTFNILAASTVVTGLYVLISGRNGDLAAAAPKVWLGIAYLAVFSTAATFFLSQYASLRLPSGKVMAYTYLIPAIVLIINTALGKGLPSLSVVAGALVVASAMLLLQRA